jgi:hypothetical protein
MPNGFLRLAVGNFRGRKKKPAWWASGQTRGTTMQIEDITHATAEVNSKQLPIIRYQGNLVLTDEQLAAAFGAETNALRAKYTRNKHRFEEGKHFFTLKGEALREFKKQHPCVSPNVTTLTLWTHESFGAFAKMLDTPVAWAIFDKMEDAYFGGRQPETEKRHSEIGASFAAELQRVFDEYCLLGYPKERAAVVAELFARHTISQ